MIALLDCNNFYVSCERIFNPKIVNKPVVVLSNNDGCVISRSNEAKKIGIKMGEPFFKIEKKIRSMKINVYSSNYSLYADISKRVMKIIKDYFSNIEIYSIDEAFINLENCKNHEYFCFKLKEKIFRWTGIPVSIGIAKTKTLAKIANKIAKEKIYGLSYNYNGVFMMASNNQRGCVLKRIKINDVWGIGLRLSMYFKQREINNAFDLKKANETFFRKEKGVLVQKTILELRGIKCYEVKDNLEPKKSICVSRSFGERVSCLEVIKSALISHVQKASEKLRKNKSSCKSVTVFLKTSRYDKIYYSKHDTLNFLEATMDTRIIWKASKKILEKIFKSDIHYNKVGIILNNLSITRNIQFSLFKSKLDINNSMILMNIMDKINKKFGDRKIRISSDHFNHSMGRIKNNRKVDITNNWLMKSRFCSPSYTTKWYDIPKVIIR